jgi:hypothetical protein
MIVLSANRCTNVPQGLIHTLQPWRAAAHLRELLMACEVLPRVDKQICLLERWLIAHLNTITDPDRAQLIQRFATWDILPRLRTRAANKPITPSSRQFAGEQITQATAFLDWLAARQRTLRTCEQADIDTWHAEHAEHWRRRLRGFLIWAMASKLTRGLRLPAPLITHGAPLPQPDRMALLGHLLTDHELPLRSRVAAVIVLLYAQQISLHLSSWRTDAARGHAVWSVGGEQLVGDVFLPGL